MATLRGKREYIRRLKAIEQSAKPIGRRWAEADVREMRSHVPVVTGRLRRSFRVGVTTNRRATVLGHHTAYLIDAGARPHTIRARGAGPMIFRAGGRTIFARQVHHRGFRGTHFRGRAAREALRKGNLVGVMVDQWNGAA